MLNAFLPGGCNLTDLVASCQANARNHGKLVSCVSKLTNGLKKAKAITGAQKGQIQRCAAHSKKADTKVKKSGRSKKTR